MAERDLIEQLERALGGASEAGPEVRELLTIAAIVRDLPREDFRTSLKSQLMNQAIKQMEDQMTPATTNWMREGLRTLTPYLHVPRSAKLVDFLVAAFDAQPVMHVDRPDGSIMHGEIRVGDSLLELSEDPPAPFGPRPVALHYYLPDVDGAYARAIAAGATSLHPPVDQSYGDREASVIDPAGNYWYLATHRGATYIPEGLHSVTQYLQLHGTPSFLDFAKNGLGAEIAERHESPDGTVVHAKLKIGDSMLEASEAHGKYPVLPASIHLYTPDVDQLYARALAAGATSISAPADQPYGDRYAGVVDSHGNRWYLATHIKDVSF